MKHTGLVSIILLNCNGKQRNKNCIDSILLQTYKNFEIIFVSNISTDGSLEEVQRLYKNEIEKGIIKVVVNPLGNTGFTGGNNLGVRNSSKNSEYICLLNNDTTVGKDWLTNLVKSIQTDEKLGAVQSVILEGDVEMLKRQIFVEKKCALTNIFSGLGSLRKITNSELKNNLCYTTWVHGCCLLYKKDIVDMPFEDYYFIYYEDTYFSYRLLSLGYKLGMCLNSFVNHYGSGTCGKETDIKQFRIARNRIINYIVFTPIIIRIIYFPLLIISELIALFGGNIMLKAKAEVKSIIRIVNNWKLVIQTHKLIFNNMSIPFPKFINIFSPNLFRCNVGKPLLYPFKIIIYILCTIYYRLFYPLVYILYG